MNNRKCISVSGFAEKKVKSDIAELKINIKNKSEDFEKLYKKRVEDKQKVIDFLKACGITEEEIISITVKSENKGEKEDNWGNTQIANQETYFSSEDRVFIRTSNFDKVDKIKNQIIKLASEGVITSYKCKYKILEPERLRAEMMSLAAKNAQSNAELLVQPFNKTIKDLDRISCGRYNISISRETDNNGSYYDTEKSDDTINKKVRVDVDAEFSFK